MSTPEALRTARVGDLVPVGRHLARRIDATAVLLPGACGADDYRAALEHRAGDFAAWDGRVVVEAPGEQPAHRLVILDRYGQVYSVTETTDPEALPDADALEDWFRFLATACPECGVLDDPVLAGPTP